MVVLGLYSYGMNVQYNRILLQEIVALITVVMRVQSTFKIVVFSKRKLLYRTIQIILDQAIFLNTNPRF